ncbi:MAG: hypothetical protein IME93_06570 [Proteobacteria bacterium]|nr:hypothetical protein [Pseudomonadota bacterium]
MTETNNSAPPIDSGDAAWVTIKSELTTDQVMRVASDIEVIFRLNPYYYIESWEAQGDSFKVNYKNNSNNQTVEQSFTVTRKPNELEINYENDIKNKTVLKIEPDGSGSVLTLIDDYSHLTGAEREQRSDEADKSQQKWGEAIYTYLARIKKWSWLPGWQTYMRRVWMPMNPSGRRVVFMLSVIAIAQFAFFILILGVWVLESARGPAL